MKQVPYWESTIIRCHHTKFSRPGLDAWDYSPEILYSLTHLL